MDEPNGFALDSTMAVVPKLHAKPLSGETKVESVTVPVNPFCAAIVRVELPLDCATMLMLGDPVERVKSCTFNIMVAT